MAFPDLATIRTIHMLVARLERLSADSRWAHHASGLRGSLLHSLERIETAEQPGSGLTPEEMQQLESLIQRGFTILESAAFEIRPPEHLP